MGTARISSSVYKIMPKYCANCGATEGLNIHHVVPLSMGGRNVITNMVVLCTDCHNKIHGRAGTEAINHSDLIKQGQARAMAQGVHIGKNRIDREPILKLIAEHCKKFKGGTWTEKEIMEKAGIRRTLFHECLNELLADINSAEWKHTFSKPTIAEHSCQKRQKGDKYDREI